MIKIQKGDIVDIIAPAGFSGPERLVKAVAELSKWGLVARTNIDFSSFHPYHSDEDEVRFNDLKNALYSDSKIIWCLRGGYGSARLLEKLSKLKKPKTSKILIGYSDITALHLFLNQKWGWTSIHGPMITSFSDAQFDKKCLSEIKNLLTSNKDQKEFKLIPLNPLAETLKTKISGDLIGGNLAIVQSLIGTKFQLKAKDNIVFLEDVNEKGYQIDRMLNHLLMSGDLAKAKAIVLGDFSGGDESGGENYVAFALTRFALVQKIPVYRSSEFGHGKTNRPLVCGKKYSILKNRMN
jgi:muramoyltetrapeptide carboxypeptidase